MPSECETARIAMVYIQPVGNYTLQVSCTSIYKPLIVLCSTLLLDTCTRVELKHIITTGLDDDDLLLLTYTISCYFLAPLSIGFRLRFFFLLLQSNYNQTYQFSIRAIIFFSFIQFHVFFISFGFRGNGHIRVHIKSLIKQFDSIISTRQFGGRNIVKKRASFLVVCKFFLCSLKVLLMSFQFSRCNAMVTLLLIRSQND